MLWMRKHWCINNQEHQKDRECLSERVKCGALCTAYYTLASAECYFTIPLDSLVYKFWKHTGVGMLVQENNTTPLQNIWREGWQLIVTNETAEGGRSPADPRFHPSSALGAKGKIWLAAEWGLAHPVMLKSQESDHSVWLTPAKINPAVVRTRPGKLKILEMAWGVHGTHTFFIKHS